MLRRNVNHVIGALLADVAATLVAVALAFWLRATLPYGLDLASSFNWNILYWEAGLLYPVVFALMYLYDPDRAFRGSEEYSSLVAGCLVGGLALAGLVYFTEREISRLALVYFYAVQFILLAGWRLLLRWLSPRRNGAPGRRVLVAGNGDSARRTVEQLRGQDGGLNLVGLVTDDDPALHAGGGESVPVLGRLDEIASVIRSHPVDDIVLALPANAHGRLTALASELAGSPCSVWIVPDYFAILVYGGQTEVLAGIPLVSIKAPTLTGYQRFMKRGFDLVLGSLTLLPAVPVMLIAALAIRLDSPGPALFRQQRVGENGRLFWTLKLRTMFVGADEMLSQVAQTDDSGRLIHKRPNDVRATRVGRLLRRTSIDELPQLLNVLRGEMSLVGPRPELPALVEAYEPWQRQRFAVPPGITGWWQVSGRGDKPMHLNTEYDLHYVRNYSLWLDLRILLMTVGAVITGKGAY